MVAGAFIRSGSQMPQSQRSPKLAMRLFGTCWWPESIEWDLAMRRLPCWGVTGRVAGAHGARSPGRRERHQGRSAAVGNVGPLWPAVYYEPMLTFLLQSFFA